MSVLELVAALARHDIGVRDSARLLGMAPSNVSHYRKVAGVPPARKPTELELLATLPDHLKAAIAEFRAARPERQA